MGNLSTIRRDFAKEQDGVWLVFSPAGLRLKLARWGNPRFQARLDELMAPHKTLQLVENLPEELVLDLCKQAASETVLVDWDDNHDDEGQPIPYSAAKALEYFHDPELSDLWLFVFKESQRASVYRKEAKAKALGN